VPSLIDSAHLRRLLILDATISGASAILLLLGAGVLADLLSIPVSLLQGAGAILIPFVALLVVMLRRQHLSRGSVGLVIVLNATWVVASLGILLDRSLTPNALGYVSIVGQAVAVAILAEFQFVGLRRAKAAGDQRPSYSAST
jgi:hypothetical protein